MIVNESELPRWLEYDSATVAEASAQHPDHLVMIEAFWPPMTLVVRDLPPSDEPLELRATDSDHRPIVAPAATVAAPGLDAGPWMIGWVPTSSLAATGSTALIDDWSLRPRISY